jgi:hypothetical protein
LGITTSRAGRRNMVTVEALGATPYFLFKANAVEPNDD